MDARTILAKTVPLLRAKLSELGLDTTGRKGALQDRLFDHYALDVADDEDGEADGKVASISRASNYQEAVQPSSSRFTLRDIQDSVLSFSGHEQEDVNHSYPRKSPSQVEDDSDSEAEDAADLIDDEAEEDEDENSDEEEDDDEKVELGGVSKTSDAGKEEESDEDDKPPVEEPVSKKGKEKKKPEEYNSVGLKEKSGILKVSVGKIPIGTSKKSILYRENIPNEYKHKDVVTIFV
ncbi:DNA-binding protein modulo-like, partial [Drosophila eugracilis]|uniref:DNA-binding protein modulo-like n=1 Tax=Drosophila eugracilis TaxID=29029 RepID=UPI001BDABE35